MKLLLLDQFSDPGGAQQGLLDLLPAIRERGWHAVVGLPGAGQVFERVREAGFAAKPIECGPYSAGRKSVADVTRFAKGSPVLTRQLREMASGADVVYINGPRLLPAAAMAGLRVPVVFHSHSLVGPGILRRLAGWALRRLNATVIANCEFVGTPWREYVNRVTIIFNGVSAAGVWERRSSGATRIACVGRIAPEKGQFEFLDVAQQIHRVVPDTRFTIYGATLFGEASGDSYEQEVRARAARLAVEFAGWIENIHSALAQTDILLVPSAAHEATTRVILEAYAAGVPVIAFASGGVPEIVDDGVTGCLTRSPTEMAAATLALLKDPARRSAMSVAGRECWARRFTLERYQDEVLAALETAWRRESPLRSTRDHIRAG